MKVALFSTKEYDRRFFTERNKAFGHELSFFEARLTTATARLAEGFRAVCPFVNDQVDREVLEVLQGVGVELLVLRSAGFNHVDLVAAEDLGITVSRVPAYSPHAVAEHTMALILGLNRQTHRAYNRVREGNFSLDGLLGFDLNGKTVGIVGTGEIGAVLAQQLKGFGCRILASDPVENPRCLELGVEYVEFERLLAEAQIISVHCPLTPATHHLINGDAVAGMRDGVMLINTSRGAIVDTRAVIEGLKSGKVGSLGLDVYEEEGDLFFEDLSDQVIQDDVFARLLTFPNVLITGHQGFFTDEALGNIADTTLENARAFETGEGTLHRVTASEVQG